MGELAYMQEKEQQAIQFIKEHPSDTARFIFHRFMATWTGAGDPLVDIWRSGAWWARGTIASNYALSLLTFIGLLLAYREQKLLSLPLLNLVAIFPLVYYLCHTSDRYRHPIDPAMTILTAYAVVRMVRAAQQFASSRFKELKREPATAI
jgi:hypothetical protein